MKEIMFMKEIYCILVPYVIPVFISTDIKKDLQRHVAGANEGRKVMSVIFVMQESLRWGK